jgi:outer membrane immunogenic protein
VLGSGRQDVREGNRVRISAQRHGREPNRKASDLMTPRVIVFAVAAAVAVVSGSVKARACAGGEFGGLYAGINGGAGVNRAVQSSPGEPYDVSGSSYAAIAGGQLGFNVQCGSYVFGLETDINYMGTVTNTAFPDPIFLRDEIDWFGTVRGKLGIAIQNNAMLYATGGVAYAGVTHTLFDPAIPFRRSDDDIKVGWTAGAGLELAHYKRWLLRAEALYVDLGANSRVYIAPAGPCGGPCIGRAKWDDTLWAARFALSYKFGVHEPAPLK